MPKSVSTPLLLLSGLNKFHVSRVESFLDVPPVKHISVEKRRKIGAVTAYL